MSDATHLRPVRLVGLPRKPFPFAELPPVAPPVDCTDAAAFPNIAAAVAHARMKEHGNG